MSGFWLSGFWLSGFWLSGFWLSGFWLSGFWLSGFWIVGILGYRDFGCRDSGCRDFGVDPITTYVSTTQYYSEFSVLFVRLTQWFLTGVPRAFCKCFANEIIKAEFFFIIIMTFHNQNLKRNKFIFFLFHQIYKLYILKYIKNGKFLSLFIIYFKI